MKFKSVAELYDFVDEEARKRINRIPHIRGKRVFYDY